MRNMTKTTGVVKIIVWYIPSKKDTTGVFNSIKKQKTTVEDWKTTPLEEIGVTLPDNQEKAS